MAKANVSLGGRDILDLDSLSIPGIWNDSANCGRNENHEAWYQKGAVTAGKIHYQPFYEPKHQNKNLAFELAGKYLGADVVNNTTTSSSVVKGDECCAILFLLYNLWLVTQSLCPPSIEVHCLCCGGCWSCCSSTPVTGSACTSFSRGLLDMFTIREQGKKIWQG